VLPFGSGFRSRHHAVETLGKQGIFELTLRLGQETPSDSHPAFWGSLRGYGNFVRYVSGLAKSLRSADYDVAVFTLEAIFECRPRLIDHIYVNRLHRRARFQEDHRPHFHRWYGRHGNAGASIG